MMRARGAVLSAIAALAAVLVLAPAADTAPATRHTTITLAPAAGDLELLELEFPRHRRRSISHSTLRLAPQGLSAGDYLAAATPRRRPHGELIALVLLVHRSGATHASARLSVRSARALGPLFELGLRDPFTSTRSAIVGVDIGRALPCKVPAAGAGLSAADLRSLSGATLGGFTPAGAVAAAYDVACHRAYPLAFRQAVHGASGEGCGAGTSQNGSLCCPRGAVCAAPAEPVPAPAPEPAPAPVPTPNRRDARHASRNRASPARSSPRRPTAWRAAARRRRTLLSPRTRVPRAQRQQGDHERAMSETQTVETEQAAREASGAHPYGRYLEEFEVGDVYKHWPAKTVTEADDHLFCLITMNHHPLHINDVYAAKSQQGRNVVVGPLVYSLALGMSVSDVSGKAIANLATEELKHPAPVFHGDTLFCESEVLEKKESKSKPDRGTVKVHTRVLNQDGVLVAEFKRLVLVPRREPGAHEAEGNVE